MAVREARREAADGRQVMGGAGDGRRSVGTRERKAALYGERQHAVCGSAPACSGRCTFQRSVMFHKRNVKNGSKDLNRYPQISRRVRDTLARLVITAAKVSGVVERTTPVSTAAG